MYQNWFYWTNGNAISSERCIALLGTCPTISFKIQFWRKLLGTHATCMCFRITRRTYKPLKDCTKILSWTTCYFIRQNFNFALFLTILQRIVQSLDITSGYWIKWDRTLRYVFLWLFTTKTQIAMFGFRDNVSLMFRKSNIGMSRENDNCWKGFNRKVTNGNIFIYTEHFNLCVCWNSVYSKIVTHTPIFIIGVWEMVNVEFLTKT